MPYLNTILITLLLAAPVISVELFRYRGAANSSPCLVTTHRKSLRQHKISYALFEKIILDRAYLPTCLCQYFVREIQIRLGLLWLITRASNLESERLCVRFGRASEYLHRRLRIYAQLT
jgi:hypothetical protein